MSEMEYIDIYDAERNNTGVKVPRKTKLSENQYMLYVYALIQNKDGKYLVTQRSLDKKWAAGQWEVPGGGSMAGETSLDAVRREILEETGLDISECETDVISTYRNDDLKGGDNYFADIYLVKKDFSLSDVTMQEKEVAGVGLADLEEIKALYENDGFLHYKRIMDALAQN